MNKIKIVFLLIAISITNHSMAQSQGDFELGFFAGASLASVVIKDNPDDLESKIGLNIGFYSDYFFSEKWSVKTKLYYDQKGFDNASIAIIDGINNRIERGSFTFHNITLPVMANFHFGKNQSFFLNLGPYASYVLSIQKSIGEAESTDEFNSIDFGLEGGIGFKFSFSDKNEKPFYIEYSGQSGLSDIVAENDGDSLRNIQHSLNLGFRF